MYNNNEVTAVIKVETKGSIMYKLNNICVSDSHKVIHNRKWINVSQHPEAIKFIDYKEPYLYCLNTSNKTITIDNFIFSDWDEIDETDIFEIMQNPYVQINNRNDIHKKIDSGFDGLTQIIIKNGLIKNLKDINVGDILQNGEKVYGIVVINGKNINEQFKFLLGNNLVIEGGPNLVINEPNELNESNKFITTLSFKNNNYSSRNGKIKINIKHHKLYHLLTDKNSFTIDNIKFYDYNAAIDIFLEKNKEKLLSKNYV